MSTPKIVGRYVLSEPLAAGGMATVYLGRLMGEAGFSRIVAIKQLHPAFAQDPEFSQAFLDEARLVTRITHPNVVPTLDVATTPNGAVFLVMEYVHGETMWRLVHAMHAKGERIPQRVACSVMAGVLYGLHAAHEAKGEDGEPLAIVHRDVSPQNIVVGVDGIARVLDFGVAKARGRVQTTRDGQIKGKLAYMAPEQAGGKVSRATDVYSASVVLWEALTGTRLFGGGTEGEVLAKVFRGSTVPPSSVAPDVPPELDAIVLRGLRVDPEERFATAEQMAMALEACAFAPSSEIGTWVRSVAAERLADRATRIADFESSSRIEQARLVTDEHTATTVTLSAPLPSQLPAPSQSPASRDGIIDIASASRARRSRAWVLGGAALGGAALAVTAALAASVTRWDARAGSSAAAPASATSPSPPLTPPTTETATAATVATTAESVDVPASADAAITARTSPVRPPPPPPPRRRPSANPGTTLSDPDGLSDRK